MTQFPRSESPVLVGSPGPKFAACQPRDLLGQVIDIAHYRGETPRLTAELLDAAAHNYFVRFNR